MPENVIDGAMSYAEKVSSETNAKFIDAMKEMKKREASTVKKRFITDYLEKNDRLKDFIMKLYGDHHTNALARAKLLLVAYDLVYMFYNTAIDEKLRKHMGEALTIKKLVNLTEIRKLVDEHTRIKTCEHFGASAMEEKIKEYVSENWENIHLFIMTVFDNTIISTEFAE